MLNLDIAPLSDGCCEHTLEFIHKSMADPPDADQWAEHPEVLIAQLVETFGSEGALALHNIMSAVLNYARKAWSIHKAFTPDPAAILGEVDKLRGKSPAAFTVEDWLALVDWIILKFLPEKLIGQYGEYLAVRAAIAGKLKAFDPHLVPGPNYMQLLPHTIVGATAELNLLPVEVQMLQIASASAAQAITGIGDNARRRIKQVLLGHLQDRVSGVKSATYGKLEQQLFDEFSYLNRDWRRVAITEAGNVQTESVIASLPLGSLVKRFEHYKGACEFCEKLNGMIFTVVDPNKEPKDGWKEVWVGKSNVGRSASPYRREDGKLVKRSPEELWWPAAGLQHPSCRGLWTPEHVGAVRDPRTKDFVDQLLAKHGLVVKERPAAELRV